MRYDLETEEENQMETYIDEKEDDAIELLQVVWAAGME